MVDFPPGGDDYSTNIYIVLVMRKFIELVKLCWDHYFLKLEDAQRVHGIYPPSEFCYSFYIAL